MHLDETRGFSKRKERKEGRKKERKRLSRGGKPRGFLRGRGILRDPSGAGLAAKFIGRFIAYPGCTTSFVSVQSGAHSADDSRKPVR